MSWPVKKFKDIISSKGVFIDGDWVESKDQDPSGEIRLIQLADVGVGQFLNKSDRYMTAEKAELLRCTYLKEGDILIARMPDPIGRACIFPKLDKQCVTVVDVCIVRPCADEIDSRWLMHLINSEKFNSQILQFVTGTTRQRISRGNLANLDVCVPPLAEQKRIAAILDKADAVRRKRQQAIQLADDFLRAVFLEMFGDPVTNPKGWEVKPLKDVLKSIKSGWSANGDGRPCEAGELGVLKISAVTSGKFIPIENKAVQSSDIPSSKKLVFPKKGDMLFSRANTRELVAASCIVVEDSLNTFLPDKLWLIKTDESQLLPEFLNYLLKIPGFKEKLTSQATGSSGSMLNISMGKFEQTECLVPPIDLQHRFTNLYWKLQETLSCFEQSYSTLQESFNSLSQKAFSSKL